MNRKTKAFQSGLLVVVSLFLISVALTGVPTTAAAKTAKAPAPATQQAMPAGPIDINTADQKTLESLPGVGAATAKRIIAARPFKNIEELQNVKGINKARYESLKDKVTVGKAGTVGTTTGAPKPAMEREKPGVKTTQPTSPATRMAAPTGPVDINTADLKTLESLPGIGRVKAQAIINHRPYAKPEDIMKVPGIKEGTYSKIKDRIVVK